VLRTSSTTSFKRSLDIEHFTLICVLQTCCPTGWINIPRVGLGERDRHSYLVTADHTDSLVRNTTLGSHCNINKRHPSASSLTESERGETQKETILSAPNCKAKAHRARGLPCFVAFDWCGEKPCSISQIVKCRTNAERDWDTKITGRCLELGKNRVVKANRRPWSSLERTAHVPNNAILGCKLFSIWHKLRAYPFP
jgi:hypothetical protein